jgi:transposase InsO family protein
VTLPPETVSLAEWFNPSKENGNDEAEDGDEGALHPRVQARGRAPGRGRAEYGITASMSRRGNCWDNACSETLFGSLKVERLHGQRFSSHRQAKDEIVAWLLWYNRARLHSTLAYVSPMRFEENWQADQPRQASA